MNRLWSTAVAGTVFVGILTGCGDGGDEAAGEDRPTIVVTTSVLGDVVINVVGDEADVVTVMPVGASPHDFQASAQQANLMREADALIVNGGGFESGLVDVIAGAEADGVPTFEAFTAITPQVAVDKPASEERSDDHAGAESAHGESDDHDDHDDGTADPHFFTDPVRMSDVVGELSDFLADAVPFLDSDTLAQRTDEYRAELSDLDDEINRLLDAVDQERRVLVTNHEAFSYFADRYEFDVIGTVIPGTSTGGGASAGQLAALVELIEREDVPAIFADTSSPARLAQTLADDVGDIEVVELFSESLGPPESGGETYIEMMRTNAERIAGALQ